MAEAIERARSSMTIRHRDAREELEVHLFRKPAERAITHRRRRFRERVRLQVVRDDPEDLTRDVVPADGLNVNRVSSATVGATPACS